MKYIRQFAFNGCGVLTVEIPSTIKRSAFEGCLSLESVELEAQSQLESFNNNEPSYLTKATRLNTGEMFENCHEDLKIYVPENNAGNSNGVEMYKGWFGWQTYEKRIEAMA